MNYQGDGNAASLLWPFQVIASIMRFQISLEVIQQYLFFWAMIVVCPNLGGTYCYQLQCKLICHEDGNFIQSGNLIPTYFLCSVNQKTKILIFTDVKTAIKCTYEYKRNIDVRSHYHRCRGKAISFTDPDCVFFALVIQHAVCMRPIILSSAACQALP